ncbi:MAG: ABC transporter ATP-binding protein [Actinobacteria bacterium]|nr:ABC transporter ATP-binding protein [Actinomycetota bacterium]
MQRLAIKAKELHVDFEVFSDRRASLKSRLIDRGVAGRQVVRALRGISFDVYEGESVGVVGLNGSGKSTLLAAVAGVLPLTRGELLVSEEPRLMGVGAALLGEASGLRNIRLGCLALGMTKQEVDEQLDELVAFTELGDAIHRPLKTYSSGMRARVQFVVATAIEPRILLIDEALGVGDKDFRQKSQQKVEELIRSAGTLMMVNHSLAELRNFCRRGIWLADGQMVMDGPIDDVIEAYEKS